MCTVTQPINSFIQSTSEKWSFCEDMQKTKNRGRGKYGSFVNTRIYELKSKHEDWYLFTFLSCSSERGPKEACWQMHAEVTRLYSLLLARAFSRQSKQLSTLSVTLSVDAIFSFSRASLRLSGSRNISSPRVWQADVDCGTVGKSFEWCLTFSLRS